jgi:bis(5'-nucleosyl)-tetraphosphatase (symmetrical)
MANYEIGEILGCSDSLHALLERLPFDPDRDRLWLVGDLVNRGPDNLGVLRWARETEARMGDRFAAVLGNHDVHLLARAAGVAEARRKDTLEDVLEADEKERDELVAWLRARPLLHRERPGRPGEPDLLLVHGGLLPGWSPAVAEELARDTEAVLQGPDGDRLLADYAERNGRFDHECRIDDRVGRASCGLAVFTLLRTIRGDGQPRCGYSGPPEDAPPGDRAWFEAWREERPDRDRVTVVFGHWASLGLHLDFQGDFQGERESSEPGFFCLDSGCVWGASLTAARLEDGELWQVATREPASERRTA